VAAADERLVLDWAQPLRHPTFYKAVYRPAVLRANRLTPTAKVDSDQSFHSLRHTYATLCLAAGIRPIDIAELMGHRDAKTTLTVYAHLINTDDHTGNMAALGALARRRSRGLHQEEHPAQHRFAQNQHGSQSPPGHDPYARPAPPPHPSRCAPSARTPPPEPTRLVPQITDHSRDNYRSGSCKLEIPPGMSKLRRERA
jgi:hypothetical protein